MSSKNSSLVELTESSFDENENPSLHSFNATDGSTKSINADFTKTSSVSVTEINKADVSVREEKLSNKNTSIGLAYLENGDTTLTSLVKNSLPESVNNNNLTNGSVESNISFPDPNIFLVENSPCSSETNLSSDANINALLNTSITFNDSLSGYKQKNLALESDINCHGHIQSASTSVCSAVPENVTYNNPAALENLSSDANINALLNTSITFNDSLAGYKQENLALESDINCHGHIQSASTSVCSAVPENVTYSNPAAIENRPLLIEESMPAQIFEFLKPASPTDILENSAVSCVSDENNDGETFQDAVQFFKDSSSLQFLDNMTTLEKEQPFVPRDSLYRAFDPLHKNYASPPAVQASVPLNVSPEVSLATLDPKDQIENVNSFNTESDLTDVSLPVNKTIAEAKRESIGNILLSFDSPMKSNSARSSQKVETSPSDNIPRLYTEEEFQQALKINELTSQENYLKKQKDMEEDTVKRLQEKEESNKRLSNLCKVLRETVEELLNVTLQLKKENETLSLRNKELESEKDKLDSDLKTSAEDLQSVENTFSDFHRRYLQCKDMLKTCKNNEDCLKEEINNLHKRIEEQEQMYDMLQTKTEDIVEKANVEVANAKKGGDAQIAVLKAQLKKSELKISSLEGDLKQVRIENDKLSGICDDLMAKVSET